MIRLRSARYLAIVSCLIFAGSSAAVGCASSDSKSSGQATTSSADSATQGLPDVPQSEFVDKTSLPEVTVTVKDNVFSPQYITVSPGTKVIFNNQGRNPHNVIPVTSGAFEQIATDDLQPEEQDQIVFDEPGMYPYYCSLHGTPKKGMNGRVQVAES
ncbi:unannotated protein [freshwater metagenome]|uniref:Unannotated protein n=1 Tax=freshwater metagenome TaxID=449393 RepID=A0A6J6BBQ0_9ZZZZ|nr:hypothetical protein [Actinomycetota bacterium]